MTAPVELAVFSLSASSPDGDDSRYLRWHALDHLPQQYEITGLLHGQRFVSTPACRAARVAESERLAPVNHVVYYLFGGAPLLPTLDEFFALRDRLIDVGRFPEWLPNRLVAGCEPVAMHAAPRALVSADVVPFRPNRGVYLVVEQGVTWSADSVDALLALDGVAGMWELAPTTIQSDELSKSGYGVSVVYLDEDPVEVARPIGQLLGQRRPALAAPFVTLQPWEWHEHAATGMIDDRLPGDVRVAVDRYLAAVDDAAPGLVETLLVAGSLAFGDYQSAISDVDLVALCRNAPTPDEHAALEVLHRPSRPNVDVLYATCDDLLRDPSTLSLPGSVDGVYRAEAAFEANPVVWRVLSTCAIAVRGVAPTPQDIWFDAAALRRWNLANLDGYWAGWVELARTRDGTEERVRSEYGFQWLVLGVPRLHYTIATLDVTSKSGAGRYALGIAPPQWRVVLETALALRADRIAPLPATPESLWRDAIELSAWFITDAHRLADSDL